MNAVSVALQNGFDRAWLLPVPPYVRWKREAALQNAPHTQRARKAVDGIPEKMRSVLLMLAPYRPYREENGRPTLSAFYVASNAAYARAGSVLETLQNSGVSAQRTDIPLKPLLAGFGLGVYGRNGLCSVEGFGTRFVLEALLTDLTPEIDISNWQEEAPLHKQCLQCPVCRNACPAKALDAAGKVDLSVCVRALAKDLTPAMPDPAKAMVFASVWGCDLCQDLCPRNKGIEPVDMPPEVRDALDLSHLLKGDVAPLAALIGTNFARKGKMRARAAMVAANTGRKDLAEEIRLLLSDPEQGVRDCARWALETLAE